MPLRNGRRADLMGIDGKGQVVIVEIKVSRADLLGDAKWPEYLDHCDRFYWGLAPHLDRTVLNDPAFLPQACGIIVADGYDAEILRPAPSLPLAAARRKVEVERWRAPRCVVKSWRPTRTVPPGQWNPEDRVQAGAGWPARRILKPALAKCRARGRFRSG
jgi:hypothetical protein